MARLRIVVGVLLCLIVFQPVADAQSLQDKCRSLLRLYGYLSIGAIKCNFKFNDSRFSDINKCAAYYHMTEAAKRADVQFGATEFNNEQREQGSGKACGGMLQNFPQYLSR